MTRYLYLCHEIKIMGEIHMIPNENLKTYSLKEMEHYKIYGRTDETQDLLPLFYNGSGIEVNVKGSEL